MFNKRKKLREQTNKRLLGAFFKAEMEWKQLKSIVENSIEPTEESRYLLSLSEARYIFLLREAKARKLSALRY